MNKKPSYYYNHVDLGQSIKSVEQVPTAIEIFSTGYVADRDQTISEVMIDQLINNFEKKVQVIEVPITYDHPASRLDKTIAAGWIKELTKEIHDETGMIKLVADVHWTRKGREHLYEGDYKYISSEIYWSFLSPRDGETDMGAVITAASLTNNPAVVTLEPITNFNKDGKMDEKKEMEKKEMENKDYNDMKAEMEKMKAEMEKMKLERDKYKKQLEEMNKKSDHSKENDDALETYKKKVEEFEKKFTVIERTKICDDLIAQGHMTPSQRKEISEYSKEAFDAVVKTLKMTKNSAYASQSASANYDSSLENEPELIAGEDSDDKARMAMAEEYNKGRDTVNTAVI